MVCFSNLQVSLGLSQPTIPALSELSCTTLAYSKKTKAYGHAVKRGAVRPSSWPLPLAQRVMARRNQF
jgi:hypothetical protein